MEQEKPIEPVKSNASAIIITVIITAALVGGGAYYMYTNNQASQPAANQQNQATSNPAITTPTVMPPTKTEPTEPLSYSTTGVTATVAKKTAPFDYTVDQLRSMSEECGNGKVPQLSGYFDQLVTKFSGAEKTIYNFKYTGASQTADTFTVTLMPNKAGYTSLDQFEKDFEICAAGGELYPSMMNANWLLFTNACGSGASDGSERPIGCEKVREVVEPTLGLKSSIADYYKNMDAFLNKKMRMKAPAEFGLNEVGQVKIECPANPDGPCGGELLILTKETKIFGMMEFYLAQAGGAGYAYYGPFTDDLEQIIAESKTIGALKQNALK